MGHLLAIIGDKDFVLQGRTITYFHDFSTVAIGRPSISLFYP